MKLPRIQYQHPVSLLLNTETRKNPTEGNACPIFSSPKPHILYKYRRFVGYLTNQHYENWDPTNHRYEKWDHTHRRYKKRDPTSDI